MESLFFIKEKRELTIKNFKNLFSINFLIRHHTYLGFKKRFTHSAFHRALLGTYSNSSIINPLTTLHHLKVCTKFLFSLFINGGKKACFIFFNFSRKFIREYLFLDSHYCMFNYWPSGLVSNELITLFSDKIWDKKNYYPQTAIAYITLGLNDAKLFSIVNEVYGYEKLIPIFTFVDSTSNLDALGHWIPTNTKSNAAKIFWLRYFRVLIKKSTTYRKTLFMSQARKQYLRIVGLLKQRINPFKLVRPDLFKAELALIRRMRLKQAREVPMLDLPDSFFTNPIKEKRRLRLLKKWKPGPVRIYPTVVYQELLKHRANVKKRKEDVTRKLSKLRLKIKEARSKKSPKRSVLKPLLKKLKVLRKERYFAFHPNTAKESYRDFPSL